MQTTQPEPAASTCRKNYPRKLTFYHPTGAGNGTAMQIEPRLNTADTDRYNCFFLEMARQKTASSRTAGGKTPATFDWENKLTVKLDFFDICEFLNVLEGRSECVGGERKGLYHENGKATTMITLQRKTDKPGYFLGLSRKDKQGGQPIRLGISLGESEAVGLRCIFQTSLLMIAFHSQLFAFAGKEVPE